MTHPGSEPPAMDATTAETPTVAELVKACRVFMLVGTRQESRALEWLGAHLPALMADAKLLDALVASPRQILVGEMPLRTARDHFRAAAHLAQGERTNG